MSAGQVQIVLSVDAATYSQAMAQAQRQLDTFAGKAQGAGHATVSSMQAASAALRDLNGDFTHNIRAVERFITTIPGVGTALRAAFPVIGGLALGAMFAELGKKVYDFIQQVNGIPDALRKGFQSSGLDIESQVDALGLATDKINDNIAKMQGHKSNNLALELDEARARADEFAKSLDSAADKVQQLLSKNHIGFLQGIFANGTTGDTEKFINDNRTKIAGLADQQQQALHGGDKTSAARIATQIHAAEDRYISDLRTRLKSFQPTAERNRAGQLTGATRPLSIADQANVNDLRGELRNTTGDEDYQSAQDDNVAATSREKKLQDAKAYADKAKQADAQRLQQMEEQLALEKQRGNTSLQYAYAYWSQRTAAFSAGSEAYRHVVQNAASASVDIARQQHELITRFTGTQRRSADSDGTEVPNRSQATLAAWQRHTETDATQGYVDSNQIAIDNAHNLAGIRTAQINEQIGRSLIRLAAAQQLANVHAQEWVTIQESHRANVDIAQRATTANPSAENQHKLTSAQVALSNASANRQIQVDQDAQAVNPQSTGITGFRDALDEFVNASRDAAAQMRDLTNNTLSSLNQTILQQITSRKGQRFQHPWDNLGAGIFKNVAGVGLQKAEGSALGILGFGGSSQLGTQQNPMYVRMANAVSSAVLGSGGLLAGKGSSGSGTSLISRAGGWISHLIGGGPIAGSGVSTPQGIARSAGDLDIPFLATGGPIDGPAIVGEVGPELFVPNSSGRIIPHNQLSKTLSGGGDTHYHTHNVDARGATDPAQVTAAVDRRMAQWAPQLTAGAVHAVNDRQKRRSPGR